MFNKEYVIQYLKPLGPGDELTRQNSKWRSDRKRPAEKPASSSLEVTDMSFSLLSGSSQKMKARDIVDLEAMFDAGTKRRLSSTAPSLEDQRKKSRW